jgi:hypothetical protein
MEDPDGPAKHMKKLVGVHGSTKDGGRIVPEIVVEGVIRG